jgi:hypothetical protein
LYRWRDRFQIRTRGARWITHSAASPEPNFDLRTQIVELALETPGPPLRDWWHVLPHNIIQ